MNCFEYPRECVVCKQIEKEWIKCMNCDTIYCKNCFESYAKETNEKYYREVLLIKPPKFYSAYSCIYCTTDSDVRVFSDENLVQEACILLKMSYMELLKSAESRFRGSSSS